MFKTAGRFLLLRFLPRRILPIVTVVEALLFLRSIRSRRRATAIAPGAVTVPPIRSGSTASSAATVRSGPEGG